MKFEKGQSEQEFRNEQRDLLIEALAALNATPKAEYNHRGFRSDTHKLASKIEKHFGIKTIGRVG